MISAYSFSFLKVPEHDRRTFGFVIESAEQSMRLLVAILMLGCFMNYSMFGLARSGGVLVVMLGLVWMRYRCLSPFRGMSLDSTQSRRLELRYVFYSILVSFGICICCYGLVRQSEDLSRGVVMAAAMGCLLTVPLSAGSFASFFAMTAPIICTTLWLQWRFVPSNSLFVPLLLCSVYLTAVRMLFVHRRALHAILDERERSESVLRQHEVMMANDSVAICISDGLCLSSSNQRFATLFELEHSSSDGVARFFAVASGLQLKPLVLERLMAKAVARARRKGVLKISLGFQLQRADNRWLKLEGRLADPGSAGTRLLWLVTDETATKKAREELSFLAQHDALTGLANRHRLLSFSRRVLALRSPLWSNSSSSLLSANDALMSSEPIAVLSIDLDGFKEINDRYGHAMGDQVLVVVARRLSHVVRSRDLVARIGGDEFIVFLDQVRHRGDAAAIVEKIGDLICAPIEINDIQLQVGASIGVALGPEDGSDLDSLLAHADRLMYATKQALRGRSARHSPTALRVKANG